jgi:hypothetical protein
MTAARPVSAQQLGPVLRPVVGTRPDRTARFVGVRAGWGAAPLARTSAKVRKEAGRWRPAQVGPTRSCPALMLDYTYPAK